MSRFTTHANAHLPLALKLMALVLLLHVEACATTSAEGPTEELGPRELIMLRVENLNRNDAAVYSHLGGSRELIGRVRTGGLEFFDLQWPIGRPLDLEVETTGGGRFRVPRPPFSGGGQANLNIASEIRESTITR